MNGILLPAALNVLALIGCALAIWVGQDNHKAPQQPWNRPFNDQLNSLNNNPAFRAADRIPLLRRSGKATVNDLAKALFITFLIAFLPGALAAPLPIVLWCSAFCFALIACILFMHPFLSHRQSFRDNARGRSPFKK